MKESRDPDARDDKALDDYWKFQGTPGPWKLGNHEHCVVSESSVALSIGGAYEESAKEYYGGYLIAESIEKVNARLVIVAPEMLDWMIRHRETLIVENLGSVHWSTEIEELTRMIKLALGHKEDGI